LYPFFLKKIVINKKDHLQNRQVGSHTHYCKFWKEWLFISDLGDNCISQYKIINDKLVEECFITFNKNCGPRHFVIKNNKMYLINELDSSIYVLKLDDTNPNEIKERIKIIQELSLLRDKKLKTSTNIHAAEIKLSGDYIYSSNRSENSISIYKILANGLLKYINEYSTMGNTPRHFDIKDNMLIVGNQDSNNIVIFEIKNEKLNYLHKFNSSSPNFINII
tara:strand:+ start:66 stop:728 length:663 start_codon:yes stop_codon:yes gene_type:complete